MKIKNYIVDNIDVIIDSIEKELCIKGISYVRIENEFHFNDQIVRLYDLELHKETIIAWSFFQSQEEKIINENGSFVDIINLSKNFSDAYCLPFIDIEYILREAKTYQPRKKQTYKQESKRVNQLLKKYKR